jgi:hypothetical protein
MNKTLWLVLVCAPWVLMLMVWVFGEELSPRNIHLGAGVLGGIWAITVLIATRKVPSASDEGADDDDYC